MTISPLGAMRDLPGVELVERGLDDLQAYARAGL